VRAAWTAGGAAILAVVLTASLGGCSWRQAYNGAGARTQISQQTLAEIRVVVKEIEREVAAFVPPDLVTGEVESTSGSLTGCSPGAASWGSHTALPVSRPPAFRELADDLREHWSRAGDFDVELTEGSTGEPRLILRSPVLGNYYVEMIEEFLQVASFSTCFAYDAERDGYDWEIGAE
jgi:hypothetical protein